jgi:hypothetical protein
MNESYNQECLTCAKIGYCAQLTIPKLLGGHVCPSFVAAAVPVIQARVAMVEKYDPVTAARALLNRTDKHSQEESIEMSLDAPTPGTTYSDRKKQFEIMPFMDVRLIGNKKYRYEDGTPILDWDATLHTDSRQVSIEKVLQFELDEGFIVPDGAEQSTQQPQQGVQQMANPYMPPNGMPQPNMMQPPGAPPPMPMPGGAPPGMMMPTMAPPMAPPPPQAAPYGMAPMAPPGAPPPVASPAQAAAVAQGVSPDAAPQTTPTGRKKRGSAAAAAAAPPPAAPPAPPGQPQQYAQPAPNQYAPQAVPATPWGGMQPPGLPPAIPAPMSMSAPMAPVAPPQQVAPPPGADTGMILQRLDALGQAVGAVGNAAQEGTKQSLAAVNELKSILLINTATLWYLCLSNSSIMSDVAKNGGDLRTFDGFVAYMQRYVPR